MLRTTMIRNLMYNVDYMHRVQYRSNIDYSGKKCRIALSVTALLLLLLPLLIMLPLYVERYNYLNILINLNPNPVYVFNAKIINHNITEYYCQLGKVSYECYIGDVLYEYSQKVNYLNNIYDISFSNWQNSVAYIVTYDNNFNGIYYNYNGYELNFNEDPQQAYQDMQEYLVVNYSIGSESTANVNICAIDTYYNSICTIPDQQLPDLLQTWSTPPISEYIELSNSMWLGSIIYGPIYAILLIIIIILTIKA